MKKMVNTITTMGAAACLAGTMTATAQVQNPRAESQQRQTQPAQTQAAGRKQILDKMGELQEQSSAIQSRINAIEQEAIEKNPELKRLQSELVDIYNEKLEEYEYPSEEELNKLRVMQQKLQAPAGDMDEAERRRLTQQFNAAVAEIQAAQQKAQNSAEFRDKQVELEQARSKAMRKVNPDVPELLKQYEEIQSEIETARQELQAVMQPKQ